MPHRQKKELDTTTSAASRFFKQQCEMNEVPQMLNQIMEHRERLLEEAQPKQMGRVLAFVNTKDECKRLSDISGGGEIKDALYVHGGVDQRKRRIVLDVFRNSERGLLIITDVAARGLELPAVDLVVQIGVPHNVDSFLNRAERSRGLDGKTGHCVLLYSALDVTAVQALESQVGVTFQPLPILDKPDQQQQKPAAAVATSSSGGISVGPDLGSTRTMKRKQTASLSKSPHGDRCAAAAPRQTDHTNSSSSGSAPRAPEDQVRDFFSVARLRSAMGARSADWKHERKGESTFPLEHSYETYLSNINTFLNEVLRDAVVLTEHHQRRTVTVQDVCTALSLQGFEVHASWSSVSDSFLPRK